MFSRENHAHAGAVGGVTPGLLRHTGTSLVFGIMRRAACPEEPAACLLDLADDGGANPPGQRAEFDGVPVPDPHSHFLISSDVF